MGRKLFGSVLLALLVSTSAITPSYAQSETLDIGLCKLPGNNNSPEHRFEDSGHILDWSRIVKPEGNLTAIVIPTDFSDVPAKSKASSELSFLKETSKFFETNSQGKFSLNFDTRLDWMRMPKTAAYYKKAFWAEKINDAIDLVDPIVNFADYDLVIFYISEGNLVTTEAGALPGFPDRGPDGLLLIRGVYLGNDHWRQIGHDSAVLTHELLHVFGLPDLYMMNKNGSRNVGVFDLMSEYNKRYGQRVFYWHKWKLGWTDDSQVQCLDPSVSQKIVISSQNAAHNFWVLPVSNRKVQVIQPWVVGKSIQAIAYEVDTKDFVWNTAGLKGSGESPIQMLRPARAGKAPKGFSNPNLSVVLRNKDIMRTSIGIYRVTTRNNQVVISFAPNS